MRPLDLPSLLQDGVVDPNLAALSWLLVEGGVPLVVAGRAELRSRAGLAAALLAVDPSRDWTLLDADEESLGAERLAAMLRGGVALGVTLAAADLEAVLARFAAMGLPEDGVRRLGLVVILEETERGLRCTSIHYLRPTERDGQGHLQRRPPAVLSAWDADTDTHEEYAWGITPELADRVDRSQADLEERQRDRARFLATLPPGDVPVPQPERVRAYLAGEPERVPAPAHEPAKLSRFRGGLLDADEHVH
jgi:hypothetical protein